MKNVDKKKFQLEFFTQFLEEKNLQEKWDIFKEENTFELAKIFRNQEGIKESYNDFLTDTLGINPVLVLLVDSMIQQSLVLLQQRLMFCYSQMQVKRI